MNSSELKKILNSYNDIVIVGHVRPDGDCIGACLALYNYIIKVNKEATLKVYMETINDSYKFLKNSDKIINKKNIDKTDLIICLDCGDKSRVGVINDLNIEYKKCICIDHHITNKGFADINIISANKSSTCEVLYNIFDSELLDKNIAECLYSGIISDTGVFRYESTSPKTMRIAASLMEFGIDFPNIIDETYIIKSYKWQKLYSIAINNSKMYFDDKCIITYITNETMKEMLATAKDLDGIAGMLRDTEKVELSVFIHELDNSTYKISFRSRNYVDCSLLASNFEGGGHIRAAGGRSRESLHDTIDNLISYIKDVI